MQFFDSWGTLENPVRQSDLQSIFGSVHGCPKHFFLSKTYPRESHTIAFRTAMGEIMHELIHQDLRGWPKKPVIDAIPVYEQRGRKIIDLGDIEEYQIMFDNLISSKEYASIKNRIIEVERSFVVWIGDICVAGTVDAIIRGKKEGSLVVVDWKSGKLKNQFEMDNSYQSRIYCYAVEHGEFFTKPEIVNSGHDYHTAWKQTIQKNTFGVRPELIYAYLHDLIPAKRKSSKKSDHYSSRVDSDGRVHTLQGERRGPCFYSTKVNPNIRRLEYSAKCAVALSKLGMWPEYFGGHCSTCNYTQKCEALGTYSEKQTVMDLMTELKIDPD